MVRGGATQVATAMIPGVHKNTVSLWPKLVAGGRRRRPQTQTSRRRPFFGAGLSLRANLIGSLGVGLLGPDAVGRDAMDRFRPGPFLPNPIVPRVTQRLGMVVLHGARHDLHHRGHAVRSVGSSQKGWSSTFLQTWTWLISTADRLPTAVVSPPGSVEQSPWKTYGREPKTISHKWEYVRGTLVPATAHFRRLHCIFPQMAKYC